MTQMSYAVATKHFNCRVTEAAVVPIDHIFILISPVKTGPPSSAVKFVRRFVKFIATSSTNKSSGHFHPQQFTGECRLSSLFSKHLIFLRGQLRLPFGI